MVCHIDGLQASIHELLPLLGKFCYLYYADASRLDASQSFHHFKGSAQVIYRASTGEALSLSEFFWDSDQQAITYSLMIVFNFK